MLATALPALDGVQRQALAGAGGFKAGVLVNNDRSFAWLTLGNLYENLRDEDRAIEAYRTAIRVEPNTAGPRTNLAASSTGWPKGKSKARPNRSIKETARAPRPR